LGIASLNGVAEDPFQLAEIVELGPDIGKVRRRNLPRVGARAAAPHG
jgi:hypothetical protein